MTNDIWKHYYCTTYRHTEQGWTQHYLFINRRDNDKRQTSFRVTYGNEDVVMGGTSNFVIIKYQAQWETYAPLIIEYCVNDLKRDVIFIEELVDGH